MNKKGAIMEKVLTTTINGYGEKVPTAGLFRENGILYLWEVNCFSARDLGLGNCLCINHPMIVETPVSTEEVIRRFGKEALDGFDAPGTEQKVFDAFGVEINELETFLRLSYRFGMNPLPVLRAQTGCAVVFSENPDYLSFPEEEPGTTIFVVNSQGEISLKYTENQQDGNGYYEVDDNDPVGMPELAIPAQ